MPSLIASCLFVAVWTVNACPVRADGDSAPVTIVLRVKPATEYADVLKVLKSLDTAQVGSIELEIAGQEEAGVSAVIRAKNDSRFAAVLKALEALQGAGVRKATLMPEP